MLVRDTDHAPYGVMEAEPEVRGTRICHPS